MLISLFYKITVIYSFIYFFTILTYDKAGLIIGCCHDCPYI